MGGREDAYQTPVDDVLFARLQMAFSLGFRHPQSSLHRKAFGLALSMVIPAAIVQPVVGDVAARQVARFQPLKFAAMEGQIHMQTHAPLRIGGFPDYEARVKD